MSFFAKDTLSGGSVLTNAVSSGFNLLDTTYNPVGLWLFDGDMLDSSGNGYNLTVAAGTEQYVNIGVPGHQAFYFDGSTYLTRAVTNDLIITGDWTIQWIVHMLGTTEQTMLSCGAAGETEAANFCYFLGVESNRYLRSIWEYSTGSNSTYDNSTGGAYPTRQTHHLMAVKSSNVISWYRNDSLFGAASTTLTAHSGGTSGFLHVGSSDSGGIAYNGYMQSLKIIDRALTSDERTAEFARTGYTS